jgi:hypothetical protein
MIPQSIYFDEDEFWCPCCKKEEMNDLFMMHLIVARHGSIVPFYISKGGGWRCPKYIEANGHDPDTAHGKGLGADIIVRPNYKFNAGQVRFIIMQRLYAVGLERMMDYPSHIHVDMDGSPNKPQKWLEHVGSYKL